jgi:soluble cytochrome b562
MEQNKKQEIQRYLKEKLRDKYNSYNTYLQDYHNSTEQLQHTIDECYEYFEDGDEFLDEVIKVEREIE